jgi:hypothetical protein
MILMCLRYECYNNGQGDVAVFENRLLITAASFSSIFDIETVELSFLKSLAPCLA